MLNQIESHRMGVESDNHCKREIAQARDEAWLRDRLEKGQRALDKILGYNSALENTTKAPHAINEQLTESGKMHSAFFHALQLLRLQRLQGDLPADMVVRMPFAAAAERARRLVERVAETRDADLARIALTVAAEFTRPETRETLVMNVLANKDPTWAALTYMNGKGLNERQMVNLKDHAMHDHDFRSYLERQNQN